MPDLAAVPLEARCQAAVVAILEDASLGRRQRHELLAVALWPSRLPARRPGPRLQELEEDEPSPRRRLPEPPPPPRAWSRVDARQMFQAGTSIEEIAITFGVTWPRLAPAWAAPSH